MSSVTIVANVGLGADEYRVLAAQSEYRTHDRMGHYSEIVVCDETEIDAVVEELEQRYNKTLERVSVQQETPP